MKIKILLILLFTSAISLASGFKAFIPKGDKFVTVNVNIEQPSISDICDFIGYNSNQFYTYMDFSIENSKVIIIVFKVFTDDIICAITENTVNSINKNDINSFLVNFNLKKEFDSYNIESTLADGVKNKSLSRDFLNEIFEQKTVEGESLIALEIGYELHFSNSVLSKYNTTDGLNKWARMWKNEMPTLYKKYFNSAKEYSDNEMNIINEINVQAAAFANTPKGVNNEYIKFHTNQDGTVNYKMLLVAHYDIDITLSQFKKINNGRYSLSTEYNDSKNYKRTTYKVNKGLYTFDENGKLVNTYTAE